MEVGELWAVEGEGGALNEKRPQEISLKAGRGRGGGGGGGWGGGGRWGGVKLGLRTQS